MIRRDKGIKLTLLRFKFSRPFEVGRPRISNPVTRGRDCENGQALDHGACIRLPKWRAIRKTVMKVPVE